MGLKYSYWLWFIWDVLVFFARYKMEASDHSNGAKPKSLMSRKLLMCVIMKTKKLFAAALISIGTLLISGCAKDGKDGATGAQGPQGNANVKSETFTISSWDYDSSFKLYKATILDFHITQEIADNGIVMVYLVSNGINNALPITIYPNSTYSETFSYQYETSLVRIRVQDSDLTQPNNPGIKTFRVVKVAPAGIIANPNINWKDYSEVQKEFNLN